ncbi:MAG: DUF4230 domain-containing protein [Pseudonocardia sp.]
MVNDLLEPGTNDRPTPVVRPRRRRATKLLAAVAGIAVLVPVGFEVVEWGGPFEQQVVDDSPAALLVALQDVAQYRAVTGTFQVLVDLERDTPYVPAILSGERTTFLATGSVDALVDFSDLGPERVVVSPDRRAVTITLPAPVFTPAAIDAAQSRVVGRERGLAERLAGVFQDSPTGEQELYVLAGTKLDAAARESGLAGRAEESTRQMLTALAGSLGYGQITVAFDGP